MVIDGLNGQLPLSGNLFYRFTLPEQFKRKGAGPHLTQFWRFWHFWLSLPSAFGHFQMYAASLPRFIAVIVDDFQKFTSILIDLEVSKSCDYFQVFFRQR